MIILGYIVMTILILFAIAIFVSIFIPKPEGTLLIDTGTVYIGGLPNLEGGAKVTVRIVKDKITINTFSTNALTIDKADLLNAEIMSENQIVQAVTLGRFLALGVFSLAFKKDKTVYKNYLVLTYEKDGKEKQIILKPYNLQKTTNIFRDYIGVTS